MLNNILAMGLLIGCFSLLFITPYQFTKGIYKIDLEGGSLTMGEKLICLTPILNVIKAEKLYTRKVSKLGIVAVAILLTLITRLLVVFLLPSVFIANLITIVLFSISLITFYIVNVLVVAMVLNDAHTMGFVGRVVLSLVYPMGQYYIGAYLPTVIKNSMREEETFK